MAGPGFHSVFVLITVFTFTQLDAVLSTPESLSDGDAWYEDNGAHDFAVRIAYEANNDIGNFVTITIYYDAEKPSAKDFFTKQLTSPLLKTLVDDCSESVKLVFVPCSTSNLKSNLNHSCVAKAVNGDEGRMGNYVLCAYSGKTLDQCDAVAGQDANAITKCVNSGPGTCSVYTDQFKTVQDTKGTKKMPGSVLTDFKGALKGVFSDASIGCDLK